METIHGSVEQIIFHNEQNGYTVAEIACEDDLVVVTGIFDSLTEGEYLALQGSWKTHPQYGEQFDVHAYMPSRPSEPDAIELYLASGIIPGIGPKTASLIVNRFGSEAFDILDNKPEELRCIPGIGEKTLKKIIESASKQRESREVILRLQEYGISSSMALRLYKVFKERTVSVLLENPYLAATKVPGMGFRRSDELAAKLGFEENDVRRIRAGVLYALEIACFESGNTFVERGTLAAEARRQLEAPLDVIEDTIRELSADGTLTMDTINGNDVYYPEALYKAEDSAALCIARLSSAPVEKLSFDEREAIHEIEQAMNLALDTCQKEAITAAVTNAMTVITGGPGTGKTTIINGILYVFDKLRISAVLAAPTGRAAKRMTETTNTEAKTIHRLLEYKYAEGQGAFDRNAEEPIDADAIIIDESSMIDISLMASLLDAVKSGTRLVFVGDADQLPSVGPGNVLSDLIESGAAETIRLTNIHRQAEGSSISRSAHCINEGLVPEKDADLDFTVVQKSDPNVVRSTIIDVVAHRMPNAFGLDSMNDIQVLSPIKRGPLGTIVLNQELQAVLNPPMYIKKERNHGGLVFREGDKVMQVKNNYTMTWQNAVTDEKGEGVFNGDIGMIQEIGKEKFSVRFSDDREADYSPEQLDELTHAYAITVHKAQGSEFPAVVMPLIAGSGTFLTRKLLYTAVTRAKKKLMLIGRRQYFADMIRNDTSEKRLTALSSRISNYRELGI